jgi:hypothetical protein
VQVFRILILLVALGALSTAAGAQSNPTLSGAARGIWRDEGLARNLRINALDANAHIVGRTAERHSRGTDRIGRCEQL